MDSAITLWQFLLQLLQEPHHSQLICWTSNDGEFKLLQAEEVARLWGVRKNKPSMNYNKLSRALRHYCVKNIIKKVNGQNFVYKFVSYPDILTMDPLTLARGLGEMKCRTSDAVVCLSWEKKNYDKEQAPAPPMKSSGCNDDIHSGLYTSFTLNSLNTAGVKLFKTVQVENPGEKKSVQESPLSVIKFVTMPNKNPEPPPQVHSLPPPPPDSHEKPRESPPEIPVKSTISPLASSVSTVSEPTDTTSTAIEIKVDAELETESSQSLDFSHDVSMEVTDPQPEQETELEPYVLDIKNTSKSKKPKGLELAPTVVITTSDSNPLGILSPSLGTASLTPASFSQILAMDSTITLWQFLLQLLQEPHHSQLICWTSNDGEFKLLQAEEVARLWGVRKNKPSMNYNKLSRALRHYCVKNIIKKVNGQNFVYKFVSYPDILTMDPLTLARGLGEMKCRTSDAVVCLSWEKKNYDKEQAPAPPMKSSGRNDDIHSGLYTSFTLNSLNTAGVKLFKTVQVENPGEKKSVQESPLSVIKFVTMPNKNPEPPPQVHSLPPPPPDSHEKPRESPPEIPVKSTISPLASSVSTVSEPTDTTSTAIEIKVDAELETESSQFLDFSHDVSMEVTDPQPEQETELEPYVLDIKNTSKSKKPKGLELAPTVVITTSDSNPLGILSPSLGAASLTPASFSQILAMDSAITLWQFLLQLLQEPHHSQLICWTSNDGEFKLLQAEEVARLWGVRKNKPSMNYNKLSRSLRHYCVKNIIKKVNGQNFVYKFVSYPDILTMDPLTLARGEGEMECRTSDAVACLSWEKKNYDKEQAPAPPMKSSGRNDDIHSGLYTSFTLNSLNTAGVKLFKTVQVENPGEKKSVQESPLSVIKFVTMPNKNPEPPPQVHSLPPPPPDSHEKPRESPPEIPVKSTISPLASSVSTVSEPTDTTSTAIEIKVDAELETESSQSLDFSHDVSMEVTDPQPEQETELEPYVLDIKNTSKSKKPKGLELAPTVVITTSDSNPLGILSPSLGTASLTPASFSQILAMDSAITLWQFLLQLLQEPHHSQLICWTSNDGEFKLLQAEEVARLWGVRKNKPSMNYNKLSRSLRHYCVKNIIKKVNGQNFVYKFVSYPDILTMDPLTLARGEGEMECRTSDAVACLSWEKKNYDKEQAPAPPMKSSGRNDYKHSGLYTSFTLNSLNTAGVKLFKTVQVENPGEKKSVQESPLSVIKFVTMPNKNPEPPPQVHSLPPPPPDSHEKPRESPPEIPVKSTISPLASSVSTVSEPTDTTSTAIEIKVDAELETESSQSLDFSHDVSMEVTDPQPEQETELEPYVLDIKNTSKSKKPKGLELAPTVVITTSDSNPLGILSPSLGTASLTPASFSQILAMDSAITLWQFLLQLLQQPHHSQLICWTSNDGEFKLLQAEEVARLWGVRKNKPSMNYNKLSRALRHYCVKNIIKKVNGQNFVYKFVSYPDILTMDPLTLARGEGEMECRTSDAVACLSWEKKNYDKEQAPAPPMKSSGRNDDIHSGLYTSFTLNSLNTAGVKLFITVQVENPGEKKSVQESPLSVIKFVTMPNKNPEPPPQVHSLPPPPPDSHEKPRESPPEIPVKSTISPLASSVSTVSEPTDTKSTAIEIKVDAELETESSQSLDFSHDVSMEVTDPQPEQETELEPYVLDIKNTSKSKKPKGLELAPTVVITTSDSNPLGILSPSLGTASLTPASFSQILAMDSAITLWQFLLQLLQEPHHSHLICWTSNDGEFKLLQAEEVARLWGVRKNKPSMNYNKLSRSLRHYCVKNIIKKVNGQNFVYKFVSYPDILTMDPLTLARGEGEMECRTSDAVACLSWEKKNYDKEQAPAPPMKSSGRNDDIHSGLYTSFTLNSLNTAGVKLFITVQVENPGEKKSVQESPLSVIKFVTMPNKNPEPPPQVHSLPPPPPDSHEKPRESPPEIPVKSTISPLASSVSTVSEPTDTTSTAIEIKVDAELETESSQSLDFSHDVSMEVTDPQPEQETELEPYVLDIKNTSKSKKPKGLELAPTVVITTSDSNPLGILSSSLGTASLTPASFSQILAMDSAITLWQFLLQLLQEPHHSQLICWTSNDGEFKLLQAEEVARLWGVRKNKPSMNYNKLSRALRHYCVKNIIKKVNGQNFVYKFVSYPDILTMDPLTLARGEGEMECRTSDAVACLSWEKKNYDKEQAPAPPMKSSGRNDDIHSGLYTSFTLNSLNTAGVKLFKTVQVENPGEKKSVQESPLSVIKFVTMPNKNPEPPPQVHSLPPPPPDSHERPRESPPEIPVKSTISPLASSVSTVSEPTDTTSTAIEIKVDAELETESSQSLDFSHDVSMEVTDPQPEQETELEPYVLDIKNTSKSKKPKGLELAPTVVITTSDSNPLGILSPSLGTASLTPVSFSQILAMDSAITLWQFLLQLLQEPHHSQLICWTSNDGEFKLLQAEEVARLWGVRKNKPSMNYNKLSRSLRHYCVKNIIKKVNGQNFVYKFVSYPDILTMDPLTLARGEGEMECRTSDAVACLSWEKKNYDKEQAPAPPMKSSGRNDDIHSGLYTSFTLNSLNTAGVKLFKTVQVENPGEKKSVQESPLSVIKFVTMPNKNPEPPPQVHSLPPPPPDSHEKPRESPPEIPVKSTISPLASSVSTVSEPTDTTSTAIEIKVDAELETESSQSLDFSHDVSMEVTDPQPEQETELEPYVLDIKNTSKSKKPKGLELAPTVVITTSDSNPLGILSPSLGTASLTPVSFSQILAMDSAITLWQFLLQLLQEPHHSQLICWTSNDGEFKLLQAEEVARLWGVRKNKPSMNYNKLSRSLRHYCVKNIIKKVNGQNFVYKFVSYPDILTMDPLTLARGEGEMECRTSDAVACLSWEKKNYDKEQAPAPPMKSSGRNDYKHSGLYTSFTLNSLNTAGVKLFKTVQVENPGEKKSVQESPLSVIKFVTMPNKNPEPPPQVHSLPPPPPDSHEKPRESPPEIPVKSTSPLASSVSTVSEPTDTTSTAIEIEVDAELETESSQSLDFSHDVSMEVTDPQPEQETELEPYVLDIKNTSKSKKPKGLELAPTVVITTSDSNPLGILSPSLGTASPTPASFSQLLPVEDEKWNGNCKMDVRSLSNTELKEQLLKRGVKPGPILPTTRSIYEKRLQQLLNEVPEPTEEKRPGNQDQYSDSEDEGFLMKKKEELRGETMASDAMQNNRQTKVFTVNVPVPRRSSLSNGFSSRPPPGPYNHIPASLAAEYNQNLATLGDEFTMERRSSMEQAALFKKEMNQKSQTDDSTLEDFSETMSQSPLGLSATRRKPIKGAAGRPIQFRYDDFATKAQIQEKIKTTPTEKSARRLIPVPLRTVIFIVVAFLELVFFTLECSPENPFTCRR